MSGHPVVDPSVFNPTVPDPSPTVNGGAMSDEMREVVVADRRHTDCRDRIIQALNKIGVSIEQCSVKIEYNKGRGQGLRLSEKMSSAVGDEDRKSNICRQRGRVANAHGFSKIITLFWLSFGKRAV